MSNVFARTPGTHVEARLCIRRRLGSWLITLGQVFLVAQLGPVLSMKHGRRLWVNNIPIVFGITLQTSSHNILNIFIDSEAHRFIDS